MRWRVRWHWLSTRWGAVCLHTGRAWLFVGGPLVATRLPHGVALAVGGLGVTIERVHPLPAGWCWSGGE